MSFFSLFLKNPMSTVPMIALQAPFLLLAYFYELGFLPIFVSFTLLASSTILLAFSKQNPSALPDKSSEERIQKREQEPIFLKSFQEVSTKTTSNDLSKGELGDQEGVDSSISVSECLQDQLSNSEDSESDSWPYHDNLDFSDSESLFEISLPSGHNMTHYDRNTREDTEGSKYISQREFLELSPRSIFQQRLLLELLSEWNEINEEENLIEIDISMGSIKCSRFEIEA